MLRRCVEKIASQLGLNREGNMAKTIKVKLKKSVISCTDKQKACVRGLGLRKIGSVSELENTPAVRGMVKKVIHLVDVLEG